MKIKEQCKNCEIINADCGRCKEFNKNIRNLDLGTKEQKMHGIDFLCWLLGVLLVFLTAFLLALK